MTDNESLRFDPPGDGPWQLDSSHFDRPFPRYRSDLVVQGFEEGQARWFERTGVPMKAIHIAIVNGFPYAQLVPLVGKPSDMLKPPPPKWLVSILTALHPGFRRRAKTARRWLESRGWRDEVKQWDEEIKPRLMKRFAALEAVKLSRASDAQLIEHLHECGEAVTDNFREHFNTNGTTIYPVGAFLRDASKWTDCTSAELLDAIRGTEVSSETDEALDRLAVALRKDPEGAGLLNGGRTPAEAIAELRSRDDIVGQAAEAWLRKVENRSVATADVGTPIGAEVPELLLENVRHAVASTAPREAAGSADASAIRAQVPEEHRARFDELITEARLVYRLRDERSTLLDSWATGLLRRALVEAGKRLAERGKLLQANHVIDLEHGELARLLIESVGPTADAIAARVAQRESLKIDDAPDVLGADRRLPPPPKEMFGGPLGELLSALSHYMEHMEEDAPAPEQPQRGTLTGFAASAGSYRGRACIVSEPDQFNKVKPGDVLIARATMPAYNVLLPIVGAIVTDKGGTLCHAAIVSREYGIPAVVGTRDATKQLEDGMMVTVDGDAGTVTF
jgi:phosphohistidine swiveling domain-containing protein